MRTTTNALWVAAIAAALDGQPRHQSAGDLASSAAQAHSHDVERTTLVIRPDPASHRLRLSATLDIANPAADSEFQFLLAGWYDTVAVRSRAGAATVTRDGDVATVRVARASAREQLRFDLSGAPGQSAGDDRPILADSSIYLLWSDRFYPANFDDWSVLSVEIGLPKGFHVFAPGRRVAARDSGAFHIERYETSEPIRVASVIADVRWVETDRVVEGRRLRTLLHPRVRALAQQIFRTSADVLDFYAERYGPYAFDSFTFATVDGIFARRAVAGGVLYEPAYLERELRATGHDAHETALLWWGYALAGRGPGSYQWTEGFGDYAEILYDEARGFPIPRIFEAYRGDYLRMAGSSDEPPITSMRGPKGDVVVHGRLPWVMQVLRFAVGDSAFDRGMRGLFTRWRFRSMTLDEFVASLGQDMGQRLDWWRDEWLLRRGVPELEWHADIAPDSGGYRIHVSLSQTGALYHLPLEIGIESGGDTKLERIRLDAPALNVEFWSASRPTGVVIDPHRRLLARIVAR